MITITVMAGLSARINKRRDSNYKYSTWSGVKPYWPPKLLQLVCWAFQHATGKPPKDHYHCWIVPRNWASGNLCDLFHFARLQLHKNKFTCNFYFLDMRILCVFRRTYPPFSCRPWNIFASDSICIDSVYPCQLRNFC